MTTSTFQVSDDLDNETLIAEYLSSIAQDENSDVLLKALDDVAKVLRPSASGQGPRSGRESLYKALSPRVKPRYETVAAVMRALKVKMVVGVGRGEWTVIET